MEAASTNSCPSAELSIALETFSKLGYERKSDVESKGASESTIADPCLLKRFLREFEVPHRMRRAIQSLCQSGFTLRCAFRSVSKEWIGPRLYFGHESLFSTSSRCTSVISSRLGRNFQHLPQWPHLLDRVLQDVSRRDEAVLCIPGTTLARSIAEFARQANLKCCHIGLPKPDQDISAWLENLLRNAITTAGPSSTLQPPSFQQAEPFTVDLDRRRTTLFVSPLTWPDAPCQQPFQDAVGMGIADRVFCLHIRKGGNLERLLHQRLAKTEQAAGRTLIVLQGSSRKDTQPNPKSDLTSWLDRGAVGWFVPPLSQAKDSSESTRLSVCMRARSQLAVRQLTCPASQLDTRRFLVHSTRGTLQLQSIASDSERRQRMWVEGSARFSTPVEVLDQICTQRRLNASDKLNRTQHSCVSFADVPLEELLARRTFRSHLGRWDWEPFGLLIDRGELKKLGARPVVYGDDKTFQMLSDAEKPYFQPYGKDSQWCQEREWRMLGNLQLDRLTHEAICLFVQYRVQAQHFAKRFPWPVCWVE